MTLAKGGLTLWDVESWTLLHEIPLSQFSMVRFSPNNRTIVACSKQRLMLFDLQDLTKRREFCSVQQRITDANMRWHTSVQRFFFSSSCSLQVLSFAPGDDIVPYQIDSYSEGGDGSAELQSIVNARDDHVWLIRPSHTKRYLKLPIRPLQGVNPVVMSRDGAKLAVVGNRLREKENSLTLWDVSTGQFLRDIHRPIGHLLHKKLLFCLEDTQLLGLFSDNTLRMWDMNHAHQIATVYTGMSPATHLTYCKHSERILVAGETELAFFKVDNTVIDELVRIPLPKASHRSVTQLSFMKQGSIFLTVHRNQIRFWDAYALEVIRTFQPADTHFLWAAVDEEGDFLVTSDGFGNLCFWDLHLEDWFLKCYHFWDGGYIFLLPDGRFYNSHPGVFSLHYVHRGNLKVWEASDLMEYFHDPVGVQQEVKERLQQSEWHRKIMGWAEEYEDALFEE